MTSKLPTENKTSFPVGSFEVTPKTVALLGAGLFLFYSSSKDLFAFYSGEEEADSADKSVAKAAFGTVLLQMTVVNTVLSIDTVIAVAGMTKLLLGAAVILGVSAVIRLLFVRQIASFLSDYPETKIVIYSFLMLIGLQLVLQSVNDDLPESAFNIIMLIAIGIALCARRNKVITSS